MHTVSLPDEAELHAVRTKRALKYGSIMRVQFPGIAFHRLIALCEATQECVQEHMTGINTPQKPTVRKRGETGSKEEVGEHYIMRSIMTHTPQRI